MVGAGTGRGAGGATRGAGAATRGAVDTDEMGLGGVVTDVAGLGVGTGSDTDA